MITRIAIKTGIGVGFWTLYASVYDTLLRLGPYTAMLDEVVQELLSSTPAGSRVFDAGCGSGNLTRRLLDRGYQVEAVDSSPGMLRRAAYKCPQANCQTADLDRPLPCPDNSFSGLTCSNVLYSLPNPRRTLGEMLRVLQPGGRLVLTNPRANFRMGGVLAQHWAQQDGLGRLLTVLNFPRLMLLSAFNIALLRREQRSRFYFPSQEELTQLLVETGFEGVEVHSTYAAQGWLARATKPSP